MTRRKAASEMAVYQFLSAESCARQICTFINWALYFSSGPWRLLKVTLLLPIKAGRLIFKDKWESRDYLSNLAIEYRFSYKEGKSPPGIRTGENRDKTAWQMALLNDQTADRSLSLVVF